MRSDCACANFISHNRDSRGLARTQGVNSPVSRLLTGRPNKEENFLFTPTARPDQPYEPNTTLTSEFAIGQPGNFRCVCLIHCSVGSPPTAARGSRATKKLRSGCVQARCQFPKLMTSCRIPLAPTVLFHSPRDQN